MTTIYHDLENAFLSKEEDRPEMPIRHPKINAYLKFNSEGHFLFLKRFMLSALLSTLLSSLCQSLINM